MHRKNRRIGFAAAAMVLAAFAAMADVTVGVSNVVSRQRYPWNGLVDIDCEIACSDPATNINLYLSAKDNAAGKSLPMRHVWLESDATHTNALIVKAGKHRLVWDLGVDAPNIVSPDVTIDVQTFLGVGNYLVIDLSGGPDATNYPVSYRGMEPPGGWTDEYKTEKLVLRMIQPGTFMMGSPEIEIGRNSKEVQHVVEISRPFYMGVYQVTQRQWELVMGTRPSFFSNSTCYKARPVEMVSWNMIRGNSSTYNWPKEKMVDPATFIGKLRAKTGFDGFDLPTEAQWEYACRAGTTTAFNNGENMEANSSTDPNMDLLGRYYYNGSGATSHSQNSDLWQGTAKVGSYLPNAWGIYDMHGNVHEWCLDWNGSYDVTTNLDPVGPMSGSFRIVRGGGWVDQARFCRSAYRTSFSPLVNDFYFGFRLCCIARLR